MQQLGSLDRLRAACAIGDRALVCECLRLPFTGAEHETIGLEIAGLPVFRDAVVDAGLAFLRPFLGAHESHLRRLLPLPGLDALLMEWASGARGDSHARAVALALRRAAGHGRTRLELMAATVFEKGGLTAPVLEMLSCVKDGFDFAKLPCASTWPVTCANEDHAADLALRAPSDTKERFDTAIRAERSGMSKFARAVMGAFTGERAAELAQGLNESDYAQLVACSDPKWGLVHREGTLATLEAKCVRNEAGYTSANACAAAQRHSHTAGRTYI